MAESWKMKYFQLKNIADKMIEQFEHESSVQKVHAYIMDSNSQCCLGCDTKAG